MWRRIKAQVVRGLYWVRREIYWEWDEEATRALHVLALLLILLLEYPD